MKKLFILTSILFLVGFSAIGQSKLAHVNTQTLIDTMPSRIKAMKEINDLSQKGEQELKELETQLEKAYNEYLTRKPTQSEAMNQYDESRLQKMQQDAQNREQEISTLLQNLSATMNEKTLKTIKDAIAIIASKKGLNYVVDENSTLYATGLNITNEVITELLRIDAISAN
ncbi:MAG: OmpH family outer membrane protein [Flavobacteriia bacterium]|nr:OmpH family outer membrane protein [Flavobacteriia bacterium]